MRFVHSNLKMTNNNNVIALVKLIEINIQMINKHSSRHAIKIVKYDDVLDVEEQNNTLLD